MLRIKWISNTRYQKFLPVTQRYLVTSQWSPLMHLLIYKGPLTGTNSCNIRRSATVAKSYSALHCSGQIVSAHGCQGWLCCPSEKEYSSGPIHYRITSTSTYHVWRARATPNLSTSLSATTCHPPNRTASMGRKAIPTSFSLPPSPRTLRL